MNKIRLDTSGWYRDWFDEDYLALYADRGETEARHFVGTIWSRLGLNPGVRIADLPCGPGRHCKAFAERGACVTGLDLSQIMLDHARKSTAQLTSRPRLVQGDLRALPFASEFDLAVNLFTSFGYFATEAENEKVFSELVRVLISGGLLLIDVVNPLWLKDHFIPETVTKTASFDAVAHKELSDNGRRIIKHIHLTKHHETREITESVRLYHSEELTLFASRCDLSPIDMWGDYDGAPFSDATPRLIFLARKN